MKRIVLFSMLVMCASQLFGAGFEAPVNRATGDTKIEGLLQAIGNLDLQQVQNELNSLKSQAANETAFKRLLNTHDNVFSPLGIAKNLELNKNITQNERKIAGQIRKELESQGARLIFDEYESWAKSWKK